MIKTIHPFPARMAPDLAISGLKGLKHQSIVLDPMAGSGTVLRQASELGHQAIGFDMDPLAVLMARVWTTPVKDVEVARLTTEILSEIKGFPSNIELPWIDEDEETKRFIEYWFAEPQCSHLRHIAYALSRLDRPRLNGEKRAAADVLRLALSRIIITKNLGASLARDVSHSRPHKVAEVSTFDVLAAFERSVQMVRQLLASAPPIGNVDIRLGDARSLKAIGNNVVDVVLTSPPYLNAIDYMRGHRLSLVWLGYRLSALKRIRSDSIGAERAPDLPQSAHLFRSIQEAMEPTDALPHRHTSMILRYAEDVYRLMSEIARVLKPGGKAILVVGNSCLKKVFIRNSDGVIRAASMVGLRLVHQVERELPSQHRYLPMPANTEEPLGKRIRTENILTFVPA
jgi:SAM-dependent methyltransferase